MPENQTFFFIYCYSNNNRLPVHRPAHAGLVPDAHAVAGAGRAAAVPRRGFQVAARPHESPPRLRPQDADSRLQCDTDYRMRVSGLSGRWFG